MRGAPLCLHSNIILLGRRRTAVKVVLLILPNLPHAGTDLKMPQILQQHTRIQLPPAHNLQQGLQHIPITCYVRNKATSSTFEHPLHEPKEFYDLQLSLKMKTTLTSDTSAVGLGAIRNTIDLVHLKYIFSIGFCFTTTLTDCQVHRHTHTGSQRRFMAFDNQFR